ncbi:transmembrane protein 115-like isoform X2 [Corticium candelabrum]|uniref:transmembrane protein 115-like isoform X2 n=1 Tax=Corticium candelabrum TaxID=121492 RepID=UPI002E271197|nr:transmembrane protein 115-like isoform X2 [Corticium candelabrum]
MMSCDRSLPPHFRLWTFLTAPLLETHWWNVVLDIILTAMAAQMLEPLWTSKELLVFVTIVGVASSVLTAFLFVLLYIPLRRDVFLFSSFHGFMSVLAGYSVAFKQIMPDHNVLPTSSSSLKSFQLKSQMLPIVIVAISTAASLYGVTSVAFVPLVGWGIVVSWIYLRFYQKRRHSDSRGDHSDTFAFATFFPEPLQPAVNSMSSPVYNLLSRTKLCPKRTRTVDITALSSVTINLPGVDKADAERRKQKALKALDERLSRAEPQADWPSLDNEASPQPKWSSLDNEAVNPADVDAGKSGLPVTELTQNMLNSVGETGRGVVDSSSKQSVHQDASSSGQ